MWRFLSPLKTQNNEKIHTTKAANTHTKAKRKNACQKSLEKRRKRSSVLSGSIDVNVTGGELRGGNAA